MIDAAAEDLVPPGFELVPPRSGFGRTNGPWYEKRDGDEVIRGFRVQERHANRLGIAHGGLLMAFADTVLGAACGRASRQVSVTMRMTTDFVSQARLGEWVEATGEVTRVTRRLVFARARVWSGRRTILTASGVFSIVRPRDTGGEDVQERSASR